MRDRGLRGKRGDEVLVSGRLSSGRLLGRRSAVVVRTNGVVLQVRC